ncbi:putative integral membrane protein pth11 [Botryosphaeria dothidea]|uniref:Integral membrane protein pth11 n=1 Tax=Botryosphaeria dothidea TaxID=55169 RepID=A0A8H4ISN4_9PEZI|nr:putative integral membrane protein pth11 [Botryosphaeria dothidea]
MATLADYLGPELASTLPPPNYVNPQTDVPAVLGTEISLTALMIIFVGMRFYSRLFVNRLFGADGRSGRLLRRPHGHNLHTGWLQVDVHEHFAVPSDLGVDEDQPINLFWKQPFAIQRNCVDVLTLLIATAALNSLGDLLVYLWPVRFLFKLQMPLKHRLGLIVLFSFGCIAFAASVCRMVYLPPSFQSIDILYSSASLLLIASIEETVGIICGCLPSVKSFLSHFFPRLFGSTVSRRTQTYVHTGAGRPSGYGDHSHNHSAKVFSSSSRNGRGRKGVGPLTEDYELEMGYGLGEMDERRLVGADGGDDERFGGMRGGIVLTQEVTVKRSASKGGRGARGRDMGLNDVAEDMDAGSWMGDLTTVGDDMESIGKRSGRSIE